MIEPSYTYKATGVRAVDGDTIDVDLDVGFRLTARLRLRLARVNTNEMHANEIERRESAERAKRFTASVIEGSHLVIATQKADAFGRYLAEVFYITGYGTQVNLNDYLLSSGMAVPYKRA